MRLGFTAICEPQCEVVFTKQEVVDITSHSQAPLHLLMLFCTLVKITCSLFHVPHFFILQMSNNSGDLGMRL